MIELCGKPLTFGDSDQIAFIRKAQKEEERKELIKKYKCHECNGTGEHEAECNECGGTGLVDDECDECGGLGYIEPEEKSK